MNKDKLNCSFCLLGCSDHTLSKAQPHSLWCAPCNKWLGFLVCVFVCFILLFITLLPSPVVILLEDKADFVKKSGMRKSLHAEVPHSTRLALLCPWGLFCGPALWWCQWARSAGGQLRGQKLLISHMGTLSDLAALSRERDSLWITDGWWNNWLGFPSVLGLELLSWSCFISTTDFSWVKTIERVLEEELAKLMESKGGKSKAFFSFWSLR